MLTKDFIRQIDREIVEDELRSYVCCPETGAITHRETGEPPRIIWSVGDRYRQVGLKFSAPQKEHRVVWYLLHGYWPKEIDHINGNGLDNTPSNLRDVDHRSNIRNPVTLRRMVLSRGNKGYTMFRGKYRVRVGKLHVGMFNTEEEALAARAAAIEGLQ